MSRKLIFLDVDGTLVDFTMHMPESAREALSIARKRGHLISLCTGRTVTNVYPWLLEFGFDAIVASAGAYVSANDKVIYHSVLANDKVQDMVEVLKEHGACFMLQGINGRYVDEENAKKMRERCMRLGLDIDGALNGLTRYDSDFNSSKTGGDAALVFNVAQKTDEDGMVTSNDEVSVEGVSVVSGNGAVTVQGAAGKSVVITNILGKVVAETILTSANATISVPAGIVAVAVDGEEAVKVVVK